MVELSAAEGHRLELAWHPAGAVEVAATGSWTPDELAGDFVSGVERLTGRGDGPVVLKAVDGSESMRLHLLFDGDLLRAEGPGRPDGPERSMFYVSRTDARNARLVAILDYSGETPAVRTVAADGPAILVERADGGTDRHLATANRWEISRAEETVRLRGLRRRKTPPKPLIDLDRRTPPHAVAVHAPAPPTLDGGLDDFDASEPIALDYEDQYRRSEEAYAGPEEFSATAVVNWDADSLYLGIDVVKAEAVYREHTAPALRLDNEPDDLHSDGVQIYLRLDPEAPAYGFLVVPADEDGAIRVGVTAGDAGSPEMVTGAWRRTETGYSLTLALTLPEWSIRSGDEVAFDLIVNEMHPGRLRRAGQLVWSGGGGWVYLRGDRHQVERLGVLELR